MPGGLGLRVEDLETAAGSGADARTQALAHARRIRGLLRCAVPGTVGHRPPLGGATELRPVDLQRGQRFDLWIFNQDNISDAFGQLLNGASDQVDVTVNGRPWTP